MSNILIVLAHPKSDSFCAALADTYKKEASKYASVELLDLYRDETQQGFFTYEDANNFSPTKEMLYFQEKITKADEIIIVHPNWWGGFPAILQNWIDWNFSKGFAFNYGDNGRPNGLLEDKKVKIFVTSGAPNFINILGGVKSRMAKRWQKQITGFCGMTQTFTMYGSVGTSGQKSDEILANVSSQARN